MKSFKTTRTCASGKRRWVSALLLSVLPVTSAALVLADVDPGGDSAGGDPTVGTLPLTGGDGVSLDQTITLRGSTERIRAAVREADGEGGVEVISLGEGEAWVRFYGNVSLELDLACLVELELGIFGGFEGGGTLYAVETDGGIGSPISRESGYSFDLEVERLLSDGLVDERMDIHAYHRCGRRTSTELLLGAQGNTLLVRQTL